MAKAKVTFKNIIEYTIGNWRYRLYYSKFRFLIRKHIREQYEMRIEYMDKECYNNGTCKMCGCSTTALQMANKACDKPCYPDMMSARDWKTFKEGRLAVKTRDKIFINDILKTINNGKCE